MKVRALRNKGAGLSPCGSIAEGQVYSVPDELLEDIAKQFLVKGWVEQIKEAPESELPIAPAGALSTETAAPVVKRGRRGGTD